MNYWNGVIMKNIFALILMLLTCITAFGQGKESYDEMVAKLSKLIKGGQYAEASDYLDKVLKNESSSKTPNPQRLGELNLLKGFCLNKMGKPQIAEPYYRKYVDIFKEAFGAESSPHRSACDSYATFLNNYALECYNNNDYVSAVEIGNRALYFAEVAHGKMNEQYANVLNNLGVYYSAQGNYARAAKCSIHAVGVYSEVKVEDSEEFALAMGDLSRYFDNLGNYPEAIATGKEALEIIKKRLGTKNKQYVRMLSDLAISYSHFEEYTESLRMASEALDISREVFGETSIDYARSASTLATIYYKLNKYNEAVSLETHALETYRRVFGEESHQVATSFNNLSAYYDALGDLENAVSFASQAANIRKNVLGDSHPDYAHSLNRLSDLYLNACNYTEAAICAENAVDIFRDLYGSNNLSYAQSLYKLATIQFLENNSKEAYKNIYDVVEIRRKALGYHHPGYISALRMMAVIDFYDGKFNEAVKLYSKSYQGYSTFVQQHFVTMTYNERSMFWNSMSEFFNITIPNAAYHYPCDTLNALAYNSQIFSKSLILNSELEVQKIIDESGDTVLANRYYKIRNDRAMLDNLYQIMPQHRKINADSLADVIEKDERVLIESSKLLGDYTQNLTITYNEVLKKLSDTDLAIEFAHYTDFGSSSGYVALVLKKGMKVPELVHLLTDSTLRAISTSDMYKTSKLNNLFWKPLEKYLEGVKNVYFSPCAKLHTIGIEYLPDDEGKVFSEKFAAYRLSSTRELVVNHSANTNFKAATYGGIQYDDINESTNIRGVGANYLGGTKIESEAVAKLLRTAKYNVTALTGHSATEESFKNLSGKGIKMLHIATHGFFFNEDELSEMGLAGFSSDRQSTEDRSLSGSGLLLAGANAVFDPQTRSAIPEGSDDGILTAKEISRLDFKGLDLVVLSACQSGLGEVTGEGVFGLQRGFKKAGAQTLVMSLWNVSDDATQLLMTEFFKNLTSGMKKREAFVSAQKVVRQKFPHPGLWAAFVMVDGI